jgi:membrane protease YdiL (CAAX protease family)
VETKRLILAIVVVFIILVAAGALIHGYLLRSTYEAMRADGFSFRPMQSLHHKLWIVHVSDLLYAILFVWIYTRGREDKPWVGQGIRYGIVMTLFTVVPQTMNDYVAYLIPHRLAIHWMLSGFITLVILGLVVAGICRKPVAA